MRTFINKYKSHILTFVFSLVFGAAVFCLYFFLKNQSLKDAVDACSIAGMALIGGGLIVIITRLGAFDTFAYGFKQLLTSMFNRDPNMYNSMADYKIQKYDQRKKKKKTYLMLFLAGLLFIIAVIVLEIILRLQIK